MRYVVLSFFLFCFVICGGLFFLVQSGASGGLAASLADALFGGPVSSDAQVVHFAVEKGESANSVGQRLADDHLIRNALAFRLVIRSKGMGTTIQAGDHELRRNMTLDQVIAALQQENVAGNMFTVPEGWRALQVAAALQQSEVAPASQVLELIQRPTFKSPSFLTDLPAGASLEGYLFPDSYQFDKPSPASAVVQQMLDDFDRRVTPDLRAKFTGEGLSLHQAVTLASIVERETAVPNERPIIAEVYLNRLHKGMRLQADPTVQYALVRPDVLLPPDAGFWKRPLTQSDLAVNSPYNTYNVTGLPPGPICNPGLASLQAVANPDHDDYLYFVAKPDGSHLFARTLDEHNQNVAKVQGGG